MKIKLSNIKLAEIWSLVLIVLSLIIGFSYASYALTTYSGPDYSALGVMGTTQAPGLVSDLSVNDAAMEYVDQKPADPLTLDIYPSGATSYNLYEDDGHTNAYITGAFSKTRFTCDDTSGRVVISIGASTGTYNGKLSARTYVLKINGRSSAPGNVTRDGIGMTRYSTLSDFDAAFEGWYYDGAADVVWVKFNISTSSGTTVSL